MMQVASTKCLPCVALVLATFVVSPVHAQDGISVAEGVPPVFEYHGMCEASAAVAVGTDMFVVANDDDNILRVYRLGHAEPVQQIDLSEKLVVEVKSPKADIEGAAQIGERIFWVGSHSMSNDKPPKKRPNRRQLFATDVRVGTNGVALTFIGRPYHGLIEALAKAEAHKPYDLAAAAQLAPWQAGALNIEGLAVSPSGKGLLIGFRSPIPRGNALIATLENPVDVVMKGKEPIFGAPVELPLGKLGVRSLERIGSEYMIVGGTDRDGGEFRLYRWSGDGREVPKLIEGVHFDSFHPEVLFAGSDSTVHVLSDDGDRKIDGVECKNLSDRGKMKFRGMTLSR